MFSRRNTKRNDTVFSSQRHAARCNSLFYVNLYYFYLFDSRRAEAHDTRETVTDLFLTFGAVFDSKGDE